MEDSEVLKSNARKSILWSFVEKIGAQGVGFIISILLSRILMPGDYGIIALLSVFIAISQVFTDSGLSNALIQNQNRTEVDYSTAFYCNITIGVIMYVLLYTCAPLVESFYGQSLLCRVLRIYGLSIIISSFSIVQKTKLIISYNFRALAIISTISVCISGLISIIIAYNGGGVWALVAYYMLNSSFATFGLWIIGGWLPRMSFSMSSLKRIFNFGSKILSANLINVLFSNIYTLVIGRTFSSLQLGYFNRSQTIANVIPSNLSNILTQASYPVFCELQNNSKQLRSTFVKYLKSSFFISAPIMTLLIGIAYPLVMLILTEKWADSIIYIQILALGYMFDPIMRLNANVINVTGRSSFTLYSEIIKKIILVIILVITISFGMKMLVWGLCLYSAMDLLIGSIFVRRIIDVSFWDELKLIAPIMLSCVLMFLSMNFCQMFLDSNFSKIVCSCFIGTMTYMLTSCIFVRNTFRFILKAFRGVKK